MGLSKKDEAQIWETMMARRRRLGPDPEDYPSVHRRMELEFVNNCLIITWVLHKIAVDSNGTVHVAPSGRRQKAVALVAVLILTMAIATTILAALAYRECSMLRRQLQNNGSIQQLIPDQEKG